MTGYQKLKRKCEYLQRQVDIFKSALTIVRGKPYATDALHKGDGSLLTWRMAYDIVENRIDEEAKMKLNHWVASNLDRETIERLLKLKGEMGNGD